MEGQEIVVRQEIAELGERPVSDEERKVACRAIVRFKGQRQGNADEEDTATSCGQVGRSGNARFHTF